MIFDEDEENDGQEYSVKYMANMRKQQAHAKKIMEEEEKDLKLLAETLPVYDRIDVTKESKVLENWRQKKREWDSVKRNIQSKVHKNETTRELLMDSVDNYRPKVEEYDTIQAAKPLQERFWAETWSSTLRGGNNSRVVTIGNMYSGLECVIDKPLLPPIMVRKPVSETQMKATSHQSSLFSSNTLKSIESRKTVLDKGFSKIRPHTLKPDNVDSLVIVAKDLFEWAIDSAEEYFYNQSVESQRENDSHIAIDDEFQDDQSRIIEVVKPTIEILSPSIVVFSTSNHDSKNEILFRNNSDISVLYRWDRYYPETDNSEFDALLTKISHVPREIVLRNNRHHFTCGQQEGIMLPGSTVSTLFTFNGKDLPGLLQEQWKLSCYPDVIIKLAQEDDSQRGSELPENNFLISLHGITAVNDEKKLARGHLSSSLDHGVDVNYVQDILEDCISRVRCPVTLEMIHQREIEYFLQINQGLLDEIKSSSQNQSLKIHVNIDRIRSMENFCKSLLPLRAAIARQYLYLRRMIHEPDESLVCMSMTVDDAVINADDLDHIHVVLQTHSNEDTFGRIQKYLLPEEKLESFDQVQIADLSPSWDYSLTNAIIGLQSSYDHACNIPLLEKQINQRIKNYEKEQRKLAQEEAKRIKAELKALRLAEREDNEEDSMDEEEEEEEEEEDLSDEDDEESEEDENLVTSTNDLELANRVKNLRTECYGNIMALFYPDLCLESMYDVTKSIIYDVLVDSDEWKSKATTAAGMRLEGSKDNKVESSPEVVYDRLPSPFTSNEGAEAWSKVESSITIFDKKRKGAIGLTPSTNPEDKRNKKNIMVASKEQVNIYYRNLYDSAKECLYSIIDNMFDSIEDILQRDSHLSDVSARLNFAMVRSTDICPSFDIQNYQYNTLRRGQVAFINIAGEYFLPTHAQQMGSAFDTAASEKMKTLRTIEKMGFYGAKAVVCIFESSKGSDVSCLESSMPVMRAYFDGKKASTMASTTDDVKILFDLCPCKTVAELIYNLQQLLNQQSSAAASSPVPESPRSTMSSFSANTAVKRKKKKRNIDPITVPVYVLEDIRLPGVIPKTPPYQAAQPSDDDIPLSLGEKDQNITNERLWFGQNHRQSIIVEGVSVDCATSPALVLQEIFDLVQSIQCNNTITWIDDSLRSIYPDQYGADDIPDYLIESSKREQGLILSSCIPFLSKRRLCSERIREAALWAKIVNTLPESKAYFSMDTSDSFADHMKRLFPKISLDNPRKIQNLAIIAGKARLDKFATIYYLADLFDSIYISGEMMIPFLSAEYNLSFPQYDELVIKYSKLCRQFMTKARMRGVKIIFPKDVIVGDLPITQDASALDDKTQASNKVSFDEGADYDGDILNLNLLASSNNHIEGYVYDIGKESRPFLRQEVLSSDFVLVWGTIGACEYNSFQDGQRCLVESASQVAYDDRSNPMIADKNKPSQTIVLGNSSVEWYSRIIDSDGEFGGDLERVGVLAYAQRQSKIMTGLLGLTESKYAAYDAMQREASSSSDEWVFHNPPNEDNDDDE